MSDRAHLGGGLPKITGSQVGIVYEQPLFRPPSESESLILQVTIGCSHNRCGFCAMYRGKRFRVKSPEKVADEIVQARTTLGPHVPRVFLADGDAMCLSAGRLTAILEPLNAAFPHLERVGIYANARDVLAKSDEELAELRRLKLGILYLGLESGDDVTLTAVDKGATAGEIVGATRRAQAAGMSTSVMVLIGVAGRQRGLLHARSSAEAINRMEPTYTGLLTYTPVPGTPLHDRIERGELELPGPLESVEEIREFVRTLDCETYFTCNHASNYLPLKGRMPQVKPDVLAYLDAALAGRLALKPEFLRGL
ncbi:MAG: radical SAM protein [Actinomycetota bacterium]